MGNIPYYGISPILYGMKYWIWEISSMTLDDILWNYTRYMGLYMVNIPYYGIYPMIYGMQYGLDNWEITNDSTAEIDG